jgi:hypothetical protein
MISLNISVTVNVLLYLYTLMVPTSGLPLILIVMVVDFALFIITICIINIYLARNREVINQQFEQFKNETPLERKKHGKGIWVYIGVSVLAMVITYVIS